MCLRHASKSMSFMSREERSDELRYMPARPSSCSPLNTSANVDNVMLTTRSFNSQITDWFSFQLESQSEYYSSNKNRGQWARRYCTFLYEFQERVIMLQFGYYRTDLLNLLVAIDLEDLEGSIFGLVDSTNRSHPRYLVTLIPPVRFSLRQAVLLRFNNSPPPAYFALNRARERNGRRRHTVDGNTDS